jgi:LCP family protein required for cell wall assembly
MNTRKFYFILTIMMTSFLFVSGVYMLYLIQNTSAAPQSSDKNSTGGSVGFLGEIVQPFVLEKSPTNILVLGGDKVAGNTDTMMLVNFNPDTMQINILSIPRDTRVKIRGLGYTKINAAYPKGGADLAMETVSNFLGTCIQYCVYVDTSAFRKIIDRLDGVDYYVPIDMYYYDPIQKLKINLKKGQQHLDGSKAEQFMRFRQPSGKNYTKEMLKYYDGSDIKRIAAQQNFIKEFIRQKTSIKYITKINNILDIVFDSVETNLTMSDALKLSQNINKLDTEQIKMFTVPGNSDAIINGIWYHVPDKSETKKIVDQYFLSDLGKGPTDFSNNDDDNVNINKSKNYTKNNPSNKETTIKGTNKSNP